MSLRFGLGILAVALLPMASNAAEFDITFQQTQYQPLVGSGYFDVDLSSVSSTFSGQVAASYIYFQLGSDKFGTDYGNASYVYNPAPPYDVTVTNYGASTAEVSITNGQVSGVTYGESHLCAGVYHCEPSSIVNLSGNMYTAFIYPAGSYGYFAPLTITAAVPEPVTAALLLPGLLTVGWLTRTRR